MKMVSTIYNKKKGKLFFLIALGMLTACSDDFDVSMAEVADEDAIQVGEPVRFAAAMPLPARTRTTAKDQFDADMTTFLPVGKDYVFTIRMYEKEAETDKLIGTAQYIPAKTENEQQEIVYEPQGILQQPEDATSSLYWQSNVKKYAFEAVANEPTSDASRVKSTQDTEDLFFAEDYIKGYGFIPAWNTEESKAMYNLDGFNYLTSKEWYAANKSLGAIPQGYTTDYYKTIPLYLKHQRARISVILRAGEGIERDQLIADPDPALDKNRKPAIDNITASIFSYGQDSDHPVQISSLLVPYQLDYTPTVIDDSENTLWTACYDAIVEPFDYSDNVEKKIAAINVSGLKFSFYAANDTKYSEYLNATDEEIKANKLAEFQSCYNLQAGQHLIITATLSKADRKVLITAYVKDWVDYPFSTICDDYGTNGKPEEIKTKSDLIQYLLDETKNRSGNVAVIVPDVLDLEADLLHDSGDPANPTHVMNAWGKDTISNSAPMNYVLHSTLNLAGATIKTSNQIFEKIAKSGKIVNGTVLVGGNVESAVSRENGGTVERINVKTEREAVVASRAGIATVNTGSIYKCTSTLPVDGGNQTTETFVGGIAAVSKYAEGEGATVPVIDQCTATARVSGSGQVKGGGIVGQGTGRIVSNVYEYGITLSQDVANFKNIIQSAGDSYNPELVSSNEWPTRVGNSPDPAGTTPLVNARTIGLYNQVIDRQEELKMLVTSGATYNSEGDIYRISDSFTVTPTDWKTGSGESSLAIGRKDDNLGQNYSGNVLFTLDGNDKVITLMSAGEGEQKVPAPMLFANVQGKIYDLTIYCADDVSVPRDETSTDVVAPLAYAVTGPSAKLSNIKVKMASGKCIEASAPGGMVVWAYDGAVIEDCHSNAVIKSHAASSGTQQTYFAGGLVNSAAKAFVRRCTYHNTTLTPEGTGTIYYGGIVGGTSTKNSETPALEISDCTSWLSWSTTEGDNAADYQNFGGIIGYTVYGESQSLENAMKDCQGNYWSATVPFAKGKSGMKSEDIIGKKNAVTPQRDNNYGHL